MSTSSTPKRDELFGKKCYHSLSDIPVDIDLAVLCTPQKTIEPLLREAASKGAGGAVVYASGYSEVGTPEGVAAEKSLKTLCAELDISLMGPNCAGFINYIDRVVGFAFISDERDRTGSVGFVSQSGQLCLSFMDNPSMRFSYSISSGNSSVVTMEDYLDYLIEDDNTKVVGLYLEGITQPEKFERHFAKPLKSGNPLWSSKRDVAKRAVRSRHPTPVHCQARMSSMTPSSRNSVLSASTTLKNFSPQPNSLQHYQPASADRFRLHQFVRRRTGICADMGENGRH